MRQTLEIEEIQGSKPPGAMRWYVAETLPRKEKYAGQNLERQDFRSFCPRFRKLRRHARREETILSPLFPGYIFVNLDLDRHPWRSINGTQGVKRLVAGETARPQPMPSLAMEQLFSRCAGAIVTKLVNSPQPGQPVQIVNGPFADCFGKIEALDANGRVRVLLDILGSERSVRMDLSSVSPA